jgi:hypothetical protein
MMTRRMMILLVWVVLIAAVVWAAHSIDLMGTIRRLHGR